MFLTRFDIFWRFRGRIYDMFAVTPEVRNGMINIYQISFWPCHFLLRTTLISFYDLFGMIFFSGMTFVAWIFFTQVFQSCFFGTNFSKTHFYAHFVPWCLSHDCFCYDYFWQAFLGMMFSIRMFFGMTFWAMAFQWSDFVRQWHLLDYMVVLLFYWDRY